MNDYAAFKDRSVLITGGTGSFGRVFAKKLLQEGKCSKVIIFSRDEWKQWEMKNSEPIYNSPQIRYFLGDIRDYERLKRAFHEVDIVIHAAALKQVPVAEYNPTEFIKTNVLGAMNIINAALDTQVKTVIALSTDKAVNPINLYGATKLCSDKLFIAASSYVGKRGYPLFSVVRYGNVLASRGSIVPLWKKMIAEGAKKLPITDPRMTRFWITLDQAADFVAKCLPRTEGGEIFVPKLPSMKITDLAEALAPGLPHEIVGIREGEKVHELMIGSEDSRHTLEFPDYYVILPDVKKKKGKPLPEFFSYTSDSNTQWLTSDQLKRMVN